MKEETLLWFIYKMKELKKKYEYYKDDFLNDIAENTDFFETAEDGDISWLTKIIENPFSTYFEEDLKDFFERCINNNDPDEDD